MDQLTSMLGGLLPQFQQRQHAQVPDDQLNQSYGQVATGLSPQAYQQSAEQAFNDLTPEERTQFAEFLKQRANESGVSVPTLTSGPGGLPSDPASLATATTAVHQQDPNLLQQMFAPGGTFSSPIAKMVLLGITAFAAQRLSGR